MWGGGGKESNCCRATDGSDYLLAFKRQDATFVEKMLHNKEID